jgi:hypothetical protein
LLPAKLIAPKKGTSVYGAYFVIVNVDKHELLDLRYLDHGFKLGDLVRGGLVGALIGLTYLLALSGSIGEVELQKIWH